jgi:hypothetical protein
VLLELGPLLTCRRSEFTARASGPAALDEVLMRSDDFLGETPV